MLRQKNVRKSKLLILLCIYRIGILILIEINTIKPFYIKTVTSKYLVTDLIHVQKLLPTSGFTLTNIITKHCKGDQNQRRRN